MPHLLRAVALAIIGLALAIACVPAPTPSPTPTAERTRAPTPTAKPAPTPEPRTHNTPTPVAQVPTDIRVTDVVAGEVQVPIALTFAPDGRLFFNEVSKGMVRILRADWTLQPEPFATLPISRRTEQGVLGLALDPDFATNRYVYVYYSHGSGPQNQQPQENRVVRFTERDGRGTELTRIVDDLPIGVCCHNGGRIGFGPDGKLYVTVGDVNNPERAQNMNRLHGKILRINPDGTIPSDNPFPDSPIFALGFRNPYGLAFHPQTGLPYITENGEVGHDEVNRVVPGGNYGNGEVDGFAHDPRFIDPIWETGLGRIAPTGATFYTGRAMPEYHNDFFFCSFNTSDLTRMRFGGPSFDQLIEHEVVLKGCYLDVTNGPDGALYFASLTGIHRFGR